MKKCNVVEGFGGRVTMTQKDPFGTLVFGKKTIDGVSQEGRLAQKPTLCVCFFLGGPNYTRYPLSDKQMLCLAACIPRSYVLDEWGVYERFLVNLNLSGITYG